MKFQPGQTGNPGGRPSIPDDLKKTLKEGYKETVDFWLETLRNVEAKWEHRNKAGENIANYAYGRPKEIIDLDISGKVDGMTIEIVRKLDDPNS